MIEREEGISESVKKAYDDLAQLSQDEPTRLLYESRLKQLRDIESSNMSSYDKGRQEGLEQGLEQGRAVERHKLIKQLASVEMSAEKIALMMGLPLAEVHKILSDDKDSGQ